MSIENQVFNLKGQWRLCFDGVVPMTTWAERGPAEAQLSLLISGYSRVTKEGVIKHVGASIGGH